MSKDPFVEFLKKKDQARDDEFRDTLLFAKSEAFTSSGRDFVESCEDFFKERGYLTPKQVEALNNVDQLFEVGNEDLSAYDLYESDFAGGCP